MKKLIYLLLVAHCPLLIAPEAFAAEARFVDCGAGYVMADGKPRDGIPTVECKKLWCRDLENGKVMGSGNAAAIGYEDRGPTMAEDNKNNEIECFGTRKWCSGEPIGSFEPEFGIYIRPGAAGAGTYRGVLSGNCHRWQLQNHDCAAGEIAVHNGSSWVCMREGAGAGGRSAVKTKAVRRSPGVFMPIRK